jgi:hypothetical protein
MSCKVIHLFGTLRVVNIRTNISKHNSIFSFFNIPVRILGCYDIWLKLSNFVNSDGEPDTPVSKDHM